MVTISFNLRFESLGVKKNNCYRFSRKEGGHKFSIAKKRSSGPALKLNLIVLSRY